MVAKRALLVSGSAAVLLSLTACGTNSAYQSESVQASTPATGEPGAAPSEFTAGVFRCTGVSTQADVADIVTGGQSVALISFSVTSAIKPGVSPYYYPDIAEVQVRAGELVQGEVRSLRMPVPTDQDLPQGNYAALIGDDGTSGSYFTSLGFAGLFVLSPDDDVWQVCGGVQDGQLAVADKGGSTIDDVSKWAEEPIKEVRQQLDEMRASGQIK